MLTLNKRKTLIVLIILSILGGLTAFYGTNLVLNSVLQKDLPSFFDFFKTFFTSFDFLLVSLDIVLAIFFFVRLYMHPTHQKRMLFVYGIILASFSFVGLICNTLSGVIVYGSFIKPYPFPGYHIVMYVYHAAMLALGFVMIFYLTKKVEFPDIFLEKTNAKYVLVTILWSFIYFISLNRFGAFLLSPFYIQWSTLTLTYPAYVALLLPAVILFNDVAYMFNAYKKNPPIGIAISAITMYLAIFSFAQIIVRGQSDQLFIQLVSPVNPLGRLLTFPYDTVLQLVVAGGLSCYTLFNAIKFKRVVDVDKLPYKARMKIKNKNPNFYNVKRQKKAKKK